MAQYEFDKVLKELAVAGMVGDVAKAVHQGIAPALGSLGDPTQALVIAIFLLVAVKMNVSDPKEKEANRLATEVILRGLPLPTALFGQRLIALIDQELAKRHLG